MRLVVELLSTIRVTDTHRTLHKNNKRIQYGQNERKTKTDNTRIRFDISTFCIFKQNQI